MWIVLDHVLCTYLQKPLPVDDLLSDDSLPPPVVDLTGEETKETAEVKKPEDEVTKAVGLFLETQCFVLVIQATAELREFRAIRAEQDVAYQQSLAIDKAKVSHRAVKLYTCRLSLVVYILQADEGEQLLVRMYM